MFENSSTCNMNSNKTLLGMDLQKDLVTYIYTEFSHIKKILKNETHERILQI